MVTAAVFLRRLSLMVQCDYLIQHSVQFIPSFITTKMSPQRLDLDEQKNIIRKFEMKAAVAKII